MPNSPINRRRFLQHVGTGTVLGALSSCQLTPGPGKERPNIVFIMADDHAFQALSCYDGRLNRTPNLDRIAREGVRFTHSFCTNSICGPSRAVMLTGKYSHANGFVDNASRFDGTQQTFPKLLQGVGYQTAMVGKWHLKSPPTGFDYWNILPGQGAYYNPDFNEMGAKKRLTGYTTDITTDIALKWLGGRNQEQPFCLLLHHKAPHRSWMPAPRHLNKYDDQEIPQPANFKDDYTARSKAAREQRMEIVRDMYWAGDLKVPPHLIKEQDPRRDKINRNIWKYTYERMNARQRQAWDRAYDPKNAKFLAANLQGRARANWKYQRYIKDYLRCIAAVDENVGRVLDYLEQAGLAENTIVVYTSDQGFYLGEHGWFDKRFMYEESLRMPLLVRYPRGIKPAVNQEDMVLNLDFAATFLDYAGVEIPGDMQGRSLRGVLEGRTPKDWRQAVYYHYFEYPGPHAVKRHYGVRTKRYKLIHFYYDIDAWELYDLEKDPREMHNRYCDPAYAKVLSGLQAQLEHLRKEYGDTDESRFLPKTFHRIRHRARGCLVTSDSPWSRKHPGPGLPTLTNGLRGPAGEHNAVGFKGWLGFEGVDFSVTVDLKQPVSLRKVAVGFLHDPDSWVFGPSRVSFQASLDGRQYHPLHRLESGVSPDQYGRQRVDFSGECKGERVRFLRVTAPGIKVCPPWHPGAGGKAWLFADEIMVNPE